MPSFWSRLGGVVERRFRVVLVVAGVVVLALGFGVTRLEFETSQESLIGDDTEVARDNRAYQEAFGGEAMIVVFSAEPGHTVDELFQAPNLDRMRALERELSGLDTSLTVITPLTAIELSAAEVGVGPTLFASAEERLREEADSPAEAAEAVAELNARLAPDATRFAAVAAEGASLGLDDPLGVDNPAFVRFLVYDDASETEVRPSLQTAFPDPEHALAIVRLTGNLDISVMGDSADAVERIVAGSAFEGFGVTATGSPVLLDEINDYLGTGMVLLGGLAVGVMVLVLFFVFRVRRRLLPLLMVVVGSAAGFGAMGYAGVPLTLITISGLPILVGVGVDFAIQTQSRFEEEIDADGDAGAALRRLMGGLAPALLIAALAAAGGFLALQISEVPQIRDFGVMLALGIGTLFVAGLMVTSATLAWGEARKPTPPGQGSVPQGVIEGAVRRVTSVKPTAILPVAVVGLAVIVAGLALEGRFEIETEPERWLPRNSAAVESLNDLRRVTQTSSDVSLLVEADDVLTDEVTAWMAEFGEAQVAEHPDALLRHASIATTVSEVTGVPPTAAEVEQVIEVAPDAIVRTLVGDDRTQAAVIFPVADISLAERAELLDEMRADLAAAPPGTRVTPAGLAVIGIEVVEALEANRLLITWAALAAVAFLLLVAYRSLTKAALPLVPVLIATGLSSVVTFASGVSLSPITAVTTPLVIATCTEFSVLIMARYLEDRRQGMEPEAAVEHGSVRIGRAFTASGLTTVGGFAVLAVSEFPLLRDFGILVALNVLVALVSALVVLPPLLVWADRHSRLTGFSPERAQRGAPT